MFRKYSRMASVILLTAVISTPVSTADQLCRTKQVSIPTRRANISTHHSIITTSASSNATSRASVSTFEALSGNSARYFPTEFPQTAENHTPSGRLVFSTVDDYTTQSLLMQEQIMMNLLNMDRKNNGLAPLAQDDELSRIARIKSADMRDNQYFAHQSPTYGSVRDMLKHFGYPYAAAGENIAHHANVDKAQAAFMSSRGHRANILSKAWTKVGIGIVFDRQGFIYATQIFAR